MTVLERLDAIEAAIQANHQAMLAERDSASEQLGLMHNRIVQLEEMVGVADPNAPTPAPMREPVASITTR